MLICADSTSEVQGVESQTVWKAVVGILAHYARCIEVLCNLCGWRSAAPASTSNLASVTWSVSEPLSFAEQNILFPSNLASVHSWFILLSYCVRSCIWFPVKWQSLYPLRFWVTVPLLAEAGVFSPHFFCAGVIICKACEDFHIL